MTTDAQPVAVPPAVVFDCDGVLIESVDIKTAAFVELFSEYPQHAEAIADHHLTHLGISRFEKFRWIYRELLQLELGDDQLKALGQRFADHVAAGTLTCPEVPGTTATLATLHGWAVPLFVASGTPQDELDQVISARGWTTLFAGVHGSPTTKPDMLTSIAKTVGTTPSQLVFVGDGWSDYQAARETGARFVLRDTVAQADRFRQYAGARVRDLADFAAKLPALLAAKPHGAS